MFIQCKLHRPGGSKIAFGKGRDAVTYHFKPVDSKADHNDIRIPHVAEVNDKEHIGKLLGITEAYEVYDGTAPQAAAEPAAASTGKKDRAELEAKLRAEIEAKVRAEYEAKAAAGAGSTSSAGDPKAADIETMSRKALIAAVQKKTGKKPHPSTSDKKLREVLAG